MLIIIESLAPQRHTKHMSVIKIKIFLSQVKWLKKKKYGVGLNHRNTEIRAFSRPNNSCLKIHSLRTRCCFPCNLKFLILARKTPILPRGHQRNASH